MWLVTKGARNGAGGTAIEPALAETLRIWYSGAGDHRDEQASLLLVRHARRNHLWLACDCQSEQATPMLSPALLSEADTYYLRRLTGRSRTEHHLDCPFFREQATGSERTERAPARNTPDGFFAVLKPAPLALAQAPDDEARPRDSASHGTPHLAKLLWRLLELSGRAGIPAVETGERTIAAEFAAIRALAERIPVAPGIPLARVLFTHPRDWTSKRVFAVLRELSKSWPKGHEPQAFMLVFAGKIHEHSIETSEGLIDIATRVRHPGTRVAPVSGPDLTLVAIGNHPDVRGYAAQRAWAQPVYNGHRFIPVDSDFDREIVDALIAARRILAGDNTKGFALSFPKLNSYPRVAGFARWPAPGQRFSFPSPSHPRRKAEPHVAASAAFCREGRFQMTDLLLNYRACGAECRDDYLRSVANENGLPIACVRKIADRLGEREDFGALILICETRRGRVQ